MPNKAYNQAQAGIKRGARRMERVRETGYKALDSAVAQLYRKLQTTQKGYGQTLTAENRRNVNLVLDRTRRTREANRRTAHGTVTQLNAYKDPSGMMTEELSRLAGDVRFAKKSAGGALKQGVKQVRAGARASEQVMDVIQESAKEQKAAAQRLAADALAGRVSEDAALIAQQQHELALAKLNQQFQLRQMEKAHQNALEQVRLTSKLSEDTMASLPGGLGVVRQQITVAASVAQKLYDKIRGGLSRQDALAELVEEGELDQADIESTVVQSLARAMTLESGPGEDVKNMTQEIMHALALHPTFSSLSKKQKANIEKFIEANVTALKTRPPADGGGGGFPNLGGSGAWSPF